MPQPAAFTATMKANIAVSRGHSAGDSAARTACSRAPLTGNLIRTALLSRTRVRVAGQVRRPDSSPEGASPLRDSAGFAPDFAEWLPPRVVPGATGNVQSGRKAVKAA